MATEEDLTYLGRLFITQYVVNLAVRLQRLSATPATLPLLQGRWGVREGNEFRVDGENKEQGPFTLLYLTFTLKHLSMPLVFVLFDDSVISTSVTHQ